MVSCTPASERAQSKSFPLSHGIGGGGWMGGGGGLGAVAIRRKGGFALVRIWRNVTGHLNGENQTTEEEKWGVGGGVN